jgi:hypothetical protein
MRGRSTSLLVTSLLMVALTTVVSGCFGVKPPPPPPPPQKPPVLDAACKGTLVASTPGSIASNAVTELSGLSASRRSAGVWWGNNDSGDTARLFAIGDDGRDLGTYALSGASAVDWEDIATGPGPGSGVQYLYAADIGDNARARPSVHVYRVPEPAVDPSAGTPAPQTLSGVDALTFTYPDAPHDAEAFVVDPTTRALYVITKEPSGTAVVFRAPPDLPGGSTTVLTQVGTVAFAPGFGSLVTGADITPAGDVIGLRTYTKVLLYERPGGSAVEAAFTSSACAGKTATEMQGEAIGFTGDGRGYVTASEGGHPALHRFEAP